MFDLRRVNLEVVRALCEAHHGYASAGNFSAYAFAVFEDDRAVAGYAWQPPPPSAAKAVSPLAPQSVLSLSRMVAIPKSDRLLKHVSKPLREQMKRGVDRTRWPVLVTYSDEGQGHTGYVYACSGWEKTVKRVAPVYEDADGRRVSRYSNGKTGGRALTHVGETVIQRWEHRVCPPGEEAHWMAQNGWRRVIVPGKVWRSGSQAYTYTRG